MLPALSARPHPSPPPSPAREPSDRPSRRRPTTPPHCLATVHPGFVVAVGPRQRNWAGLFHPALASLPVGPASARTRAPARVLVGSSPALTGPLDGDFRS